MKKTCQGNKIIFSKNTNFSKEIKMTWSKETMAWLPQKKCLIKNYTKCTENTSHLI